MYRELAAAGMVVEADELVAGAGVAVVPLRVEEDQRPGVQVAAAKAPGEHHPTSPMMVSTP
jgi:hypothetical protein